MRFLSYLKRLVIARERSDRGNPSSISKKKVGGLPRRLRLLAMTRNNAPGESVAFYSVIVFLTAMLAFPSHGAPKVQEVVTPQGIKALLVEAHDLPVLSLIVAFTDSGSASDPADKAGRAYMASRLLTQGAGDLDAEAFSRQLQERAISLTSAVDGDFFNVNVKTLSEQSGEAFRLLGLAITKPRFDEEAIARIHADALADLSRQESDGSYLAARGWESMAYPAHPYGQPRQGTSKTLAALTAEDYRHFTSHYLARDTMLIAAVGDITPQKLSELLDANLAGMNAKSTPDHAIADAAMTRPGAMRAVKHESPQTMVAFGLPALKRADPQFYALYLLNHILGGGMLTSHLSEELREKRGLVYYVTSFCAITLHGDALQGSFATRNAQAKEAIAVFKKNLAGIQENGVTEEELREAKDYLLGSFALQLDSSMAMANMLIAIQAYHLGNDYMEKRNRYLGSVTRAQVNALAKKLLAPERALISVVGQPEGIEAAP